MKPFGQKLAAIAILSSLSTSVAGVCAAQTAAGNLEASAGAGGTEATAEASAEAAPAPVAEPVPPEPPPAPEPPPPPPPVVEVAPPPPPPPLVRPYGLIKPTVIFAGRSVESYGQPNASAATAAANPVLTSGALSHESNYTLQVAQSRFGLWFAEGQPVRGQLEFDFIDIGFAKSSPAQQAIPRLRIAKVEWSLSESTVLMAGQDWDLWGPINPHGINLVGGSFQAGNTGFMRQQAKLIWHNDSLELGGALGMIGSNATAKAAIPEFNGLPSLAARAAVLFGSAGRIGADVLATQWRFNAGTATEKKAFAGGVGIYGDVTPAERFNLRFEAYYGQNMANMGTLGIGFGHMGADGLLSMKEVGGFLSAKYGFSDTNGVYGVFGLAKVLNDSDVAQSYSAPVVDAMGAVTTPPAYVPTNGPGIKQNMNVRLGYEYRYDKSLAFLLEGFMFKTKHALDAAQTVSADRSAFGIETGLLFTL